MIHCLYYDLIALPNCMITGEKIVQHGNSTADTVCDCDKDQGYKASNRNPLICELLNKSPATRRPPLRMCMSLAFTFFTAQVMEEYCSMCFVLCALMQPKINWVLDWDCWIVSGDIHVAEWMGTVDACGVIWDLELMGTCEFWRAGRLLNLINYLFTLQQYQTLKFIMISVLPVNYQNLDQLLMVNCQLIQVLLHLLRRKHREWMCELYNLILIC